MVDSVDYLIDPLSDVLASVRAQCVVTGRFVFTAPWGYSREAVSGCAFRICSGLPFYLQASNNPVTRIEPGDIVLLPRGAAHTIMSSANGEVIPFDTLAGGVAPHEPLSLEAGGGGGETLLYGGIIWYESEHTDILFQALPDVIHFPVADAHLAPWLTTTLKAFINESMRREPGWRVAALKLAELLLVDVLRAFIQNQDVPGTGWLRGLTDPRIAHALGLMHRHLDRDWHITSLAALVGMSRSRFVVLFETLVGEPPISYLQNYRLRAAAKLLGSHPKPAIINVALAVGYQSEKGFARAFSRRYGVPPGSYSKSVKGQKDCDAFAC